MIRQDLEFVTAARICSYITLIQKRASGELKTTASWLRAFVDNHPLYKKDSVVSDEVGFSINTQMLNGGSTAHNKAPTLFVLLIISLINNPLTEMP